MFNNSFKYLIHFSCITLACILPCQHSNAATTSSACSTVAVVSAKADPSGSGYKYILTLRNTGSTSVSSKITSYTGSTAYNSSTKQTIAAGASKEFSVLFNSCNSYIKLENSQTITSGGSTSTSTCSTTISINSASGYCGCGCCPSTPTPVPQPPVCDAGGPYTGDNIVCSKTPVAVQLDGSGSKDQYNKGLSYKWSSNCPSGSFNNSQSISPVLSLITAPASSNNPAVSCYVDLTVTNTYGKSTSCSTLLAAKACKYDCAGTLNGSAILDRCGVCNGDGSTCDNCQSTNIQGNQLALDSGANQLRDNVLKLNKQLKSGVSSAKLSSKEVKTESDYISGSNNQAQTDYTQAWQTIYTGLPGAVISCTATFCVNVSTTGYKASIAEDNDQLYKLAKKSYTRLLNVEKKAKRNKSPKLRKVQAAVKKAKSILDSSAKINNYGIQELSKIPGSQSSC